MYQFLKKIIKFLIPSWLFKHTQSIFRNLLYLFYLGSKYQCLICNAQLSTFLQLPNKDLLCPRCGSLPRTRRLLQVLNNQQLLKGKILHFSPPLSLYKYLKNRPNVHYVSSDFENEFIADEAFDITQISAPEESFDLFIAYHVLEHIVDDLKAMKELYRILKFGGKGVIQTPFKDHPAYEDYTITSEQERLKHFGQKDHVRIYSVQTLQQRLKKVGFEVKLLSFADPYPNKNGFKLKESVLLVSK